MYNVPKRDKETTLSPNRQSVVELKKSNLYLDQISKTLSAQNLILKNIYTFQLNDAKLRERTARELDIEKTSEKLSVAEEKIEEKKGNIIAKILKTALGIGVGGGALSLAGLAGLSNVKGGAGIQPTIDFIKEFRQSTNEFTKNLKTELEGSSIYKDLKELKDSLKDIPTSIDKLEESIKGIEEILSLKNIGLGVAASVGVAAAGFGIKYLMNKRFLDKVEDRVKQAIGKDKGKDTGRDARRETPLSDKEDNKKPSKETGKERRERLSREKSATRQENEWKNKPARTGAPPSKLAKLGRIGLRLGGILGVLGIAATVATYIPILTGEAMMSADEELVRKTLGDILRKGNAEEIAQTIIFYSKNEKQEIKYKYNILKEIAEGVPELQTNLKNAIEYIKVNYPKQASIIGFTPTKVSTIKAPKTRGPNNMEGYSPNKSTNATGSVYTKVSSSGYNRGSYYPSSAVSNSLNGGSPATKVSTGSDSITYTGTKGSEKEAMEYFMSQDWTKEQAAGIVGNLIVESNGLNTAAIRENDAGDGLHSYGIAQWNKERWAALQQFAASKGKPWTDFKTQLEFVQHELNTSENEAANALRQSSTAQEAAAIVDQKYERSKQKHTKQRQEHAARLAGGKFEAPSNVTTTTTISGSSSSSSSLSPEASSIKGKIDKFLGSIAPDALFNVSKDPSYQYKVDMLKSQAIEDKSNQNSATDAISQIPQALNSMTTPSSSSDGSGVLTVTDPSILGLDYQRAFGVMAA
jgi:hypothetical protein